MLVPDRQRSAQLCVLGDEWDMQREGDGDGRKTEEGGGNGVGHVDYIR